MSWLRALRHRRLRHLPTCRRMPIGFVGRAGGHTIAYTCAPGCPVREHESRRDIERFLRV